MADDVVKNPNRRLPTIPKPYTPQYVKLDRIPVEYDYNPSVFMLAKHPTKKNTIISQSDQSEEIDTRPVGEEQANRIVFNYDDVQVPNQDQYLDEEQQNTSGFSDQNHLESKELTEYQPSIKDELINLNDSDYCILICGDFIVSSSSKDEIESYLHQILFVDPKFKNINKEDVILLKRIGLRIGVLALE